MSGTIVLATLRQRLTSPLRLAILAALAGFPLLPIMVVPQVGFAMLGSCSFIALTLAAGLIGQEVSSGTLPLTLARPVTRTRYVVSRWAAVVTGTVMIVVFQMLLAALVMTLRRAPVPWAEVAPYLADAVLAAAGTAAVMTLLSALVPGLGDLGLLLLIFVSAQVMEWAAQARHWDALARAALELLGFIKPELSIVPFLHGAGSWFAVVSYLSTVTLCLALAIVALNRRELSYASAG